MATPVGEFSFFYGKCSHLSRALIFSLFGGTPPNSVANVVTIGARGLLLLRVGDLDCGRKKNIVLLWVCLYGNRLRGSWLVVWYFPSSPGHRLFLARVGVVLFLF